MPCLWGTLGGRRLWIKRDDPAGLASGGNKTRKLEFLMADGLNCVLVLTGNDPGEVTGMIGLIRQGVIRRDGHVLFRRSGGTTGLFAIGGQLAD